MTDNTENEPTTVIGNPLIDGYHLLVDGTRFETRCGYQIPLDHSMVTHEGEPTCPDCLRLLEEDRASIRVPEKVAMVGSRGWTDRQMIEDVIWRLPPETVIISGGARGADKLVEQGFNVRWMHRHDVTLRVFEPNWDQYGKSAGFRRNAEMVDACDRVIAFWDGKSKGTAHTIELARKAGKPVTVYAPGDMP